ncbi:MAG: GDSL-type esterase/lipase family protein [Micrococcales bacterium]|nr:GDSL-type esterase/lipase family protein [Micrococcales bacterium]
MADRPLRIVVVGDELVAGAGDPRGLGWVGRVAARTHAPAAPAFLALAVPGENTGGLSARWEAEAMRRWAPEADNRLVVAPSRADVATGLSLARTRLNLANVLDTAARHRVPTFVVGPPPGTDDENDRVEALTAACCDVARRRRLPYVDCFTPLVAHQQWLADLAAGDGRLPGQAGYGLMAWLVLHTGWHPWLGLPDDR